MKIQGKIKLINETQTFESGFTKREFVLTTNDTYPQDIKIEMIKDKCSLLDLYKVGSDVEVSINLRGSMYNDKYYVNVQGWKINKAEAQGEPIKPMATVEDDEDLLPF